MMRTFIFIPGYYGSSLVDEDSGHSVWADPKEVLLGRKTLAMPIPGMTVPGARNLAPDSLIQDIRLFGGLIKEDAYNKTIHFLQRLGGHVETVAWDWRQEPLHGVKKLHEKVLQIKKMGPQDELILVSHSFGSMVAAYYLRYGIQDYTQAKENWQGLGYFSKVILSAAPFRGLMGMFRNMHKGLRFFLNTHSQSPLAFSTFESSYYLLPQPGQDLVKDENFKSLALGLHDPEKWVMNRWGLFHERLGFSPDSLETRTAYVSKHLSRAKKFHALMDAAPKGRPENSRKILYLSGHGHKTVQEGVWLRKSKDPNVFLYYPRDFKKWMPSVDPEIVYGDGDGTVPNCSAELPTAFRKLDSEIVTSPLPHLAVLQNPRSQNRIHEFLLSL